MTIFITGIAVVSIALGAAGAVWGQDYWRQRKAPRELKPIVDWRSFPCNAHPRSH